MSSEHKFFLGSAVVTAAIVFAAFAPSYYLRPLTPVTHDAGGQPVPASLPLVVHAHAALFSGWIVLFVVQSALVATRRTRVHRRLGAAAAALVPLMFVMGLVTAVRGARDGWNPGGPYPDALGFMIVGVVDITIFAALAAAGLYYRRRPEIHKRLMLFASLGGLMWPAITRLPVVAGRAPVMFALLILLLLAPAAHDFWSGARARWVSVFVALAILATFPLRVMIGTSVMWREFAARLVH